MVGTVALSQAAPLLAGGLNGADLAPEQLYAAQAILADGEHALAVEALHDLARLPNREIALATADVVQRRLGVDLGLAMPAPGVVETKPSAIPMTLR